MLIRSARRYLLPVVTFFPDHRRTDTNPPRFFADLARDMSSAQASSSSLPPPPTRPPLGLHLYALVGSSSEKRAVSSCPLRCRQMFHLRLRRGFLPIPSLVTLGLIFFPSGLTIFFFTVPPPVQNAPAVVPLLTDRVYETEQVGPFFVFPSPPLLAHFVAHLASTGLVVFKIIRPPFLLT